MAKIIKTVEIETNTKAAAQGLDLLNDAIEQLDVSSKKLNKTTKKGNDDLSKSSKEAEKGVGGISQKFKLLGTAIKAAGIGLIIAAFAKLSEIFMQNQNVSNLFNTAFEAVSIALNDFVNFIVNNGGSVVDFFKAIFENPLESVKALGASIKANIIERFESFLDTLGFLASAVKKVFSGDFKGALEDVKAAGKESIDVFTGINNTVDRTTEFVAKTAKAVKDYATETLNAAKANVELSRTAEIGIAQNRLLLEQFDRQAELQRQIRDDESKTIEERIAANERLGEILDKQEKLTKANAQAVVDAAQAQFDKLKNDENEIALLDAKAEREGVLAQITGLRSEQLVNTNSLERERVDLLAENAEKEIEIAEKKAQAEIAIQEQVTQAKTQAVDAAISLFGAETAAGKAALVAKQLLAVQEMINEAKKTITFSSLVAARSAAAVAEGTAQTAKIGFPQNIPMLIGYALQAVGIIGAIRSAVGKSKSVASSLGGGGGASTSTIQQPQATASAPPSFNIVGASDTNQLADAIGGQTQQPIQAFVVANDVTTAQSLENNIVEGATLG